jgi:long-chain fatty acid transport protein
MPVQRPTACHAPRILACALALFLTGLVASAPRARASGYAVREGSADQTANAYAGDTAKAYDASTAFANPAGMVLLDQTQVEGDITAILPSFTFHGRDALAPGVDIPGRTGGSVVENAADLAYFAVISASPDLKFGIAVTAPFGQRVSNGADFVGRYQSLVSSIADYEITLSAAYRINRYFSIGGGPVIDYFKARLTQAINTGPTAALTGDPVADIHGDPQINMGYNIGAMLMPSDQLRFGIDYRSRIDRSLNASQTVSVPALLAQLSPLTAYELSFLDSEVHTKIAQPDNLSLGAYWQVTPKLAVMSDVQWTDWSLFRHLVLTSANGLPPNVTPENWHDTWFGSIGASYRVLPALLLQAGLAYDESPVNSGNRTTRLPDYNRFFSGLGLTWSAARNVDVTIGWNHLFAAGAEIDTSASPSAGTLTGKYDNHAESVALGANVRF